MDHQPSGWHLSGNAKQNYQIGLDTQIKYQGKSSGYISSTIESEGFGTMMQSFRPAEKYLGKRIRLTAHIKTEEVSKWTGLWMRLDGPGEKELGFDNMMNRPIKGNTDWKLYTIVLDVTSDTEVIAFGILLVGKGKAWLDNLKFDVVDESVPVTNINKHVSTEPVNLDFEE